MLEKPLHCTADSLKAMSHPLRLKILCALGDREMYVNELVESLGTSQSNLSHHLATMRLNGVLNSRRDAKKILYRVKDTRTLEMVQILRDIFCVQ